ncbi:MAG: hypothetical protein JWP11_3415 [Frankiales bacterium]|nr:hypothetical protein [Frankiales bacterium]
MHAIVDNDPEIKAKAEEFATWKDAESTYVGKLAAAVKEQQDARADAIKRGELYDPKPLIPVAAAKGHFEAKIQEARAAVRRTTGARARQLVEALHEREREILTGLAKGSTAAAVGCAEELEQLRDTKIELAKAHLQWRRDSLVDERPLHEPPTGRISPAAAVDAALAGGSLLGPIEGTDA